MVVDRRNFKNVDLTIIDEVSMVGNVTLYYLHRRLREFFGDDTEGAEEIWFGGMSLLFLGDLLQLAPVAQDPIFAPIKKGNTGKSNRRYRPGWTEFMGRSSFVP